MRFVYGQPAYSTPCKIDLVSGALAVTSPYDPAFVASLKATIPASDRKWDGDSKCWMVSPQYGSQVQRLVSQHYGVAVSLPDLHSAPTVNEMRVLDVRYLGACKVRDDGAETAFGWSFGGWNVIFPKSTLLEWFGQTSRPDEAQTLYGVLGVSQSVDDVELKKAWKRLARTWHPDVSREPGSVEQFRAIQEAYEILGDPIKRGKYNAGLQFESMSKAHRPQTQHDIEMQFAKRDKEWRAPLRCGLILVECQIRLERYIVSKIIEWQDITNSHGETLVSFWAAGDDHFTESWVVA